MVKLYGNYCNFYLIQLLFDLRKVNPVKIKKRVTFKTIRRKTLTITTVKRYFLFI